jgi:hypothetical protein
MSLHVGNIASSTMSETSGLQAELSWIESAVDKSAEAYFEKFEICDRLIGYRRYKSLICSDLNNMSKATKKALKGDFVHWKASKGVKFWLDRRTHLSTVRAAGSLAEAAEPYVEGSFRRNISRMEARDHTGAFVTLLPVIALAFDHGCDTLILMLSSGHTYVSVSGMSRKSRTLMRKK